MKKLQKEKISNIIIEEIEKMLRSGEIKEGDKLPNENVLAKQLGVSRMSLREALHTLQLMGVIKKGPRTGTIVLLGNPDMWTTDYKSPPLLNDRTNTMELLEARRAIEASIVKIAVAKATKEDIALLRDKLLAMEEALKINDLQQYIKYDNEFHFVIANITRNKYLLNAFLSIFHLINQFMSEIHQIYPGMIFDSIKYHKLIYEDIIEKNSVKVGNDMINHIRMIERTMEEYYSNQTQRQDK